MTPKAEALLDALIDASRETGNVVHEYHELSRYITELERKLQAYDGMLAYVEKNAQRACDESERIIRNL